MPPLTDTGLRLTQCACLSRPSFMDASQRARQHQQAPFAGSTFSPPVPSPVRVVEQSFDALTVSWDPLPPVGPPFAPFARVSAWEVEVARGGTACSGEYLLAATVPETPVAAVAEGGQRPLSRGEARDTHRLRIHSLASDTLHCVRHRAVLERGQRSEASPPVQVRTPPSPANAWATLHPEVDALPEEAEQLLRPPPLGGHAMVASLVRGRRALLLFGGLSDAYDCAQGITCRASRADVEHHRADASSTYRHLSRELWRLDAAPPAWHFEGPRPGASGAWPPGRAYTAAQEAPLAFAATADGAGLESSSSPQVPPFLWTQRPGIQAYGRRLLVFGGRVNAAGAAAALGTDAGTLPVLDGPQDAVAAADLWQGAASPVYDATWFTSGTAQPRTEPQAGSGVPVGEGASFPLSTADVPDGLCPLDARVHVAFSLPTALSGGASLADVRRVAAAVLARAVIEVEAPTVDGTVPRRATLWRPRGTPFAGPRIEDADCAWTADRAAAPDPDLTARGLSPHDVAATFVPEPYPGSAPSGGWAACPVGGAAARAAWQRRQDVGTAAGVDAFNASACAFPAHHPSVDPLAHVLGQAPGGEWRLHLFTDVRDLPEGDQALAAAAAADAGAGTWLALRDWGLTLRLATCAAEDAGFRWQLLGSGAAHAADPASWPAPRVEPASARVGDALFVFGGRNAVPLHDLWRYDLASGAWTQLQQASASDAASWLPMSAVTPATGAAAVFADAMRVVSAGRTVVPSPWGLLLVGGLRTTGSPDGPCPDHEVHNASHVPPVRPTLSSLSPVQTCGTADSVMLVHPAASDGPMPVLTFGSAGVNATTRRHREPHRDSAHALRAPVQPSRRWHSAGAYILLGDEKRPVRDCAAPPPPHRSSHRCVGRRRWCCTAGETARGSGAMRGASPWTASQRALAPRTAPAAWTL